jgi:glutaminyl-tRNA synthetase
MGPRLVEFSRELYIEADDFMEEPPKKYFRLSPGREVRLKSAYFVTCTSVEKDENGNVEAIHCEYDPATKGGNAPDGRKVKGTIHWVSAAHAIDAEVRLYDRLFNVENPSDESKVGDFTQNLNPSSMEILKNCKLEGNLKNAKAGDTFQFLRLGYFCVDTDSTDEKLIFNRTVALKDSWAKKA